MLNVIKELSDFGSHPAGSKQELKIAKYIGRFFEKFCDELVFDEFKYFDVDGIEKNSVNVIGNFGDAGDKSIIICANIDTIRDLNKVVDIWEKNKDDVSNIPHVEGANEPNSSIALLIFLAEKLSKKKFKKNVKIIGFGAQEDWNAKLKKKYKTNLSNNVRKKFEKLGYLIGSRHYVLSNDIKNIDSVVAIDAVAIGTPKNVIRDSFGKSTLDPSLLPGLENIKVRGFRYKPGNKTVEVIGCDHLPFRISGIPSTWIIAQKGSLVEKSFLGNILNHDNIPNYGTSDDSFDNLINHTSEKTITYNFDLICNEIINFIEKR